MADFTFDPAELGPLDCTPWDEKLVERLSYLTPYDADELLSYVAEESAREALDYIKDDGQRIIIPITPAPVRFTSRHVKSLKRAFQTLAGAVAKVAAAWLDMPALQQVLPLQPYEADWLRLAQRAPGNPAEQVFHRWDFAINVSGDPDAEHFKLFEVNSVDVGGIHYAGAAHFVMDGVLMELGAPNVWGSPESCGADPRLILMTALMFHPAAKAIKGHRKLRVAIAENQDFTTGITEAESISKFFRQRFIKTECVDARRLEAHPEYGVAYLGKPVDVVYRNIELRDLADLEAAGGILAGMRAAAQAGKLLSSPFGELDHKSLWEALGSDEFSELFTADERQLIAQHVPWTRLLRERKTADRAGRQIDLAEYVRQNRSDLVLKPNRSCGGQGVTIGRITSVAGWEHALEAALKEPDTWVVQQRIPIPRRQTCRVTEDGRFEPDEVFTVYGGFNSVGGPGFVGRASHSPVVNVMQGGGLLAVMGKMPKGK
jgi:diaminobutyrate-2-oxoglutarate transaminase